MNEKINSEDGSATSITIRGKFRIVSQGSSLYLLLPVAAKRISTDKIGTEYVGEIRLLDTDRIEIDMMEVD